MGEEGSFTLEYFKGYLLVSMASSAVDKLPLVFPQLAICRLGGLLAGIYYILAMFFTFLAHMIAYVK